MSFFAALLMPLAIALFFWLLILLVGRLLMNFVSDVLVKHADD